MFKKRITGWDLKILFLLPEVFQKAVEQSGNGLFLHMEDITGLTIKTKMLHFVEAFGELGFSGPLACVEFVVEGKLSFLKRGGFKVEGTIGRPDAKSEFKPEGVWRIKVGSDDRNIDYRIVDPTKQILTSHS